MMNVKKFVLIYVAVAAAIAFGITGVSFSKSAKDPTITVDGITGASIPMKTGLVSLEGETLMSLLEYGGAAYLLSTVSEDGSPQVTPINPKVDADGNIRFVSGKTKTRYNLDVGGKGMLTVYAISCGEENAGMHLGARIALSRVGEQVSPDKIKTFGLRTMVLHIDEVLPLEEKVSKKPKAPYRR